MRSLIPRRWKREESLPSVWPQDFRREFDDLVNRFFGEESLLPGKLFGRPFSPAVDVTENDREIVVKAELPGIDQENLKVDLANGVLTIRGEKKEEKEEKGDNIYRVERSFGSFSRSFRLPCEVQEDKAEAKYKDGILSLTLPKAETSKRTSIKVKVE